MSDVPRPLTSSERAARNRVIVSDRLAGRSWEQTARRAGLSVRHAKRGFDEAVRAGAEEIDPEDVVRRVLAASDAALERLTALSYDRNGSVAVAAARALPGAAATYLDLLSRVGLTPEGPDRWAFLRDLPAVAAAFAAAAADAGIPAEDWQRRLGLRVARAVGDGPPAPHELIGIEQPPHAAATSEVVGSE